MLLETLNREYTEEMRDAVRGSKCYGHNIRTQTKSLGTISSRLRNNAAPVPDDIPPDVIRLYVDHFPDLLLETLNGLLERVEFPEQLKVAKRVLNPKPGKKCGKHKRIPTHVPRRCNRVMV